MSFHRTAWVKLNRQQTGFAPSPNCERGATEQSADHVLTACPIHETPQGAQNLTILDDKTQCWVWMMTPDYYQHRIPKVQQPGY